MCKKLPYCSSKIDPCIKVKIDQINVFTQFRTLLSCCGHGKYPKTIVVLDNDNKVFEWFTHTVLSEGIRPGKRYYKKDEEGYYYLPEVV